MRIVPALTGTNRMADQDIMLGGYLVPRKTMIWCNLNAMFSSPEAWHEPDKYIPASALYLCQRCHWGVSVLTTQGVSCEKLQCVQIDLGCRNFRNIHTRQGVVDVLAM